MPPEPTAPGSVGDLPTMAQLDELSADLDDIDAVLARMDEQRPGSVPDDGPDVVAGTPLDNGDQGDHGDR